MRNNAGVALLASEITVLFRRKRTWAMLLALAAVPVLVAVAVKITGSGRGPAFISQISENGLFVTFAGLLLAVPLFLPLTVGVVSGDAIAGEASTGTLRYLLVAPAGRIRLLVIKYIGIALFCLAASLTVAVAGALIGAALFPIGPTTLLSGDTIDVGDALVRAMLIALYVTLSLLGFAAVGLFISTLTDVPVGAMAASVVLDVAVQIADSLPQLEWLHPFLFSHYWLSFGDLLRQPIAWDSFGSNAVLQAGYIVVFGALAYARFVRKDILS